MAGAATVEVFNKIASLQNDENVEIYKLAFEIIDRIITSVMIGERKQSFHLKLLLKISSLELPNRRRW